MHSSDTLPTRLDLPEDRERARASSTPCRLLVADDQPDVLEALRLLLKGEGYQIDTAASPAGVVAALEDKEFDVLLMDLNYARDTTSGQEGLDLLHTVRTMDPTLPAVVMTAWGSVDVAVEAMRRGARDFIQKPWDNARLLAIVRTQVELSRALRRGQRLEAENLMLRGEGQPHLIADAPAMQPVLQMIARVGPSDANILITGENGTGKGLVAQALHAVSPRAPRPLVTVNAGGVSEGVFESELFGHVRGAFTDAKADRVGRFEMAEGGTLFLDEIANVPLSQQNKLLRVLETGDFERLGSSRTRRANVRLISATNADLHAEVAGGRFRQDLLFRLNTIEIHLPPLRERRADIPELLDHYLGLYSRKYEKGSRVVPPTVLEVLLNHNWPGNVRALRHAAERAVIMADGDQYRIEDFPMPGGTQSPVVPVIGESLNLDQFERQMIERALRMHHFNISLAATVLGLSRGALYRRMEKYGL